MIIDSLTRIEMYAPLVPHLLDGIACLRAHQDDAAPARYDFPGGYLLLQEGMTCPAEGDFEAHRAYLDVQVMLAGCETVFWADRADLTEAAAYIREKDAAMYAGQGIPIDVKAGMFYICWPHDAHKPGRGMGEPCAYRKAIMKLAVE